MSSVTPKWTTELLGSNATEADLEQLRAWGRELAAREPGTSVEDAMTWVWEAGDGDIYLGAANLDLTAPEE